MTLGIKSSPGRLWFSKVLENRRPPNRVKSFLPDLRGFGIHRHRFFLSLVTLVFVHVLILQPVAYAFVGGQAASLVLGQGNFTNRPSTPPTVTTQSVLAVPQGVAFDSRGDLWVAEEANNRVLEFSCTATASCVNGNEAVLVIGQSNFTTYAGATTQNGFIYPVGLAFDSSGNLWVADKGNSRVLEFASTMSPIPEFPSGLGLLMLFTVVAYGIIRRQTAARNSATYR